MPDSLVKQEEVKFDWYHVISADHIFNSLKFSRVDGTVVRFQVFFKSSGWPRTAIR